VKYLKQFWKDESGLSTLEYIIGAGVMAALAIAVFFTMQDNIEGTGDDVGGAIEKAGDESSKQVDKVD